MMNFELLLLAAAVMSGKCLMEARSSFSAGKVRIEMAGAEWSYTVH